MIKCDMKIAWLHNYSYPEYVGGAELTDFYWLKKSKELHLDVQEVTFGSEIPLADFYILGNTSKFNHQDIKKAIQNKPYVCIVHGGKISRGENGILDKEIKDLYGNAKALVCMSPEQATRLKKIIKDKKIILAPPFIDPSIFYNFNKKRAPNSYLYVGAIREHKGILKILALAEKNKENTFHFYGPSKDKEAYLLKLIEKTPNCFYYGSVQNSDLPEIMNKYENFVWYLDPKFNDFESFGRTIVEAILCGIKLKVDEKSFGVFSWDWDFSNPIMIATELKQYYNSFWRDILNIV